MTMYLFFMKASFFFFCKQARIERAPREERLRAASVAIAPPPPRRDLGSNSKAGVTRNADEALGPLKRPGHGNACVTYVIAGWRENYKSTSYSIGVIVDVVRCFTGCWRGNLGSISDSRGTIPVVVYYFAIDR